MPTLFYLSLGRDTAVLLLEYFREAVHPKVEFRQFTRRVSVHVHYTGQKTSRFWSSVIAGVTGQWDVHAKFISARLDILLDLSHRPVYLSNTVSLPTFLYHLRHENFEPLPKNIQFQVAKNQFWSKHGTELKKHDNANSSTGRIILRLKLLRERPHDGEPIADFISRLSTYEIQLQHTPQAVSDEDLILHILCVLSATYAGVARHIKERPQDMRALDYVTDTLI